jgi:hypothetical protein
MTVIKSKGTILSKQVANAYVAVSQVISLDLPDMQTETFEADTLDNAVAGIPYKPTGRSEGGKVSGELFLDPVGTSFKYFTALITAPASSNWQITFADTNATVWPFTAAGVSLGGNVALKEGVKAKFGMKLDGLPTLPA